MKTTIFFFLCTFLLPLAFSDRRPFIRLPNEAEYPPPVLDIEGNPVVTESIYYAFVPTMPIISPRQYSISVDNFENPKECPSDVFIHSRTASDPGRPLSFYPFGGATGEVQELVPLNVAFYEPNPSDPCANMTVWKLDDDRRVVTGGVIGDTDDVNNWFSIRKVSCEFGIYSSCYIFLGIGTVDNLKRLGINANSQTPFVFVKATKTYPNLGYHNSS